MLSATTHTHSPRILSPFALQRGRPFAVGGIGMISTASYAARKFGVRRWVGGSGTSSRHGVEEQVK